jgi:hypothetical protein
LKASSKAIAGVQTSHDRFRSVSFGELPSQRWHNRYNQWVNVLSSSPALPCSL